jgi:ferredoxin
MRPAKRQKTRNQLSVNNDHCRRYGFCVAEAPSLFQLSENGGLRYRRTVDPGELDQARAAVRTCPTLAIVLAEAK